jgi:hypothetical protein
MRGHSLRVFVLEEKRHNCLSISDMLINCNYEPLTEYQPDKALLHLRDPGLEADVFVLAASLESRARVKELLELKATHPQAQVKEAPTVFIVAPAEEEELAREFGAAPERLIRRPVRAKDVEELALLVPHRQDEGTPSRELIREIRVLGQGATGIVKLVENVETRQKYAVKIINF